MYTHTTKKSLCLSLDTFYEPQTKDQIKTRSLIYQQEWSSNI